MAIKRASISANLRADATQWQRGCDTARAATDKLKKDVEKTTINGPKANFAGFSSTALKTAAGATAIGAGLKKVFSEEMSAEGLLRSLAATDRATESLRDQVQALIKTSEQPGVGSLKTAALMQIEFQSIGFEAHEARKAIEALGNQAAVMQLPQEELVNVAVAMRQIGKGAVDAQNLREITSRLPTVANAMDGLDKKDPGKFLRAFIDRLSALPKVTAGAKEDFDSLADSINQMLASATGGRLTQFGSNLARVGKSIITQDGKVLENIEKIKSDQDEYLSPIERFEKSAAERAAVRARIEEQALKDQIAKRQQLLDITQQMDQADQDAYYMGLAKADQNEEQVAMLEDAAEVTKRLNELRETGLQIDEDIVDAIKRQVAQRREDIQVIRAAAAAKQKADEEQDLKIANLRQRGKNRQADKEEDKMAVDKLVKGGMKKEDAEDLVGQRRNLEEDKALGPGRRRIRSVRPQRPSLLPERDRPLVPLPAAKDVPAKPQNNAPPQQGTPESSGMGADFGRMLKELQQIRQNTEKTASEKQQGQRREAA